MILAINAYSAKFGGGLTYLKNFLEHLPPKDVKIYLFAHSSTQFTSNSSVEVVSTIFPVHNPLFRVIWELFVLPVYLKILRVDVLFCPGGTSLNVPFLGVPTITMFRNMLPFDSETLAGMGLRLRLKNWILSYQIKCSIRWSDVVIYISDFAKNVMRGHLSDKGSVVVPHGVPDIFYTVVNERVEAPYILYVSRFEPYKRHMELILAYFDLPEALRCTYRLIIVGESDSSHGIAAKKLIAEKMKNGVVGEVQLLGFVEYNMLPEMYQGASLFVFPSVCENCPNILLEAMASGCPILTSNRPPMSEFIQDGAEYFDPDNHLELVQLMADLLSDPSRLANLSKRAKERAKNYTWAECANRTWEVLFQLSGVK